jgi:hypothetical protein
MIINNKNIRGIFLYDPEVTFEKDDFVIYNGEQYVCLGQSTGEVPEGSSVFRPYISSNQATMEDIVEFVKNPKDLSIGEKTVSAALLGEVLSTFLSGVDYSGLINNSINVNNSILINNYFNNTVKEYDSSINPLDAILTNPNLNNAIFKVSREVALGLVPVSETTQGSLIQTGLLLRQYTYSTNSGNFVRVQELIDYESGNIMFRYSESPDKTKFGSSSSTWRDSYVKSDYVWQMNKIKNYYYRKIQQLNLKISSLSDKYRYTRVDVSEINSFNTISIVNSVVDSNSRVFKLNLTNFTPGITKGKLEILITGYNSDNDSFQNANNTYIIDSIISESDINMTLDLGRITSSNRVLTRSTYMTSGNTQVQIVVNLICSTDGSLYLSISNKNLALSLAGVYTEMSLIDEESTCINPVQTVLAEEKRDFETNNPDKEYKYSYLTWYLGTSYSDTPTLPIKGSFKSQDNYFVAFNISITGQYTVGSGHNTENGNISVTVNLRDVLNSPTGNYVLTLAGPCNFHSNGGKDSSFQLILKKGPNSNSQIIAQLVWLEGGTYSPIYLLNSDSSAIIKPIDMSAVAYYYNI